MLKQLEPGFKRTINRLFVLSFKDENGRERYKQYYPPTVEIKYYNIIIDEKKILQSNNKKWFKNNILQNLQYHEIATCEGDDYSTEGLLDYPYFKEYYKLIVINLSK